MISVFMTKCIVIYSVAVIQQNRRIIPKFGEFKRGSIQKDFDLIDFSSDLNRIGQVQISNDQICANKSERIDTDDMAIWICSTWYFATPTHKF